VRYDGTYNNQLHKFTVECTGDNNFENRPTLGEVMDKSIVSYFLTHRLVKDSTDIAEKMFLAFQSLKGSRHPIHPRPYINSRLIQICVKISSKSGGNFLDKEQASKQTGIKQKLINGGNNI